MICGDRRSRDSHASDEDRQEGTDDKEGTLFQGGDASQSCIPSGAPGRGFVREQARGSGLTEKRSLRTEKQKAHGTGRPSGARTTHCIVMDVAVDSNACLAKDS